MVIPAVLLLFIALHELMVVFSLSLFLPSGLAVSSNHCACVSTFSVFLLLQCYSVQFMYTVSYVVVQLQCLPPAFLLSNNKSKSSLDIIMVCSFSMLPCFCYLYMWNFLLISSRGPFFYIFYNFHYVSCVAIFMSSF
jgi:hypothetical protein